MRIAILSPPWFPVPPVGYGGIEAIVSLLTEGLVEAGHDVTLFASGDSRTRARLVAAFPEAPSERIGTTSAELRHVLTCLAAGSEFDVVSDHSGPLAAAIGSAAEVPVVHTVHGPLDGEAGAIYRLLVKAAPAVRLVSLSLNQRRPAPDLPWIATCPNALDLTSYHPGEQRGDWLLFLGRMSPEKGAHRAIEVARRAGARLKLAGKCREPAERTYFEEHVRPHLDDRIEYLGEVSQGGKLALLQQARATLFPIDWEEPFGLVMIESMACSTPVLATRRGAVPEVVADGIGGIVVDHYEDMVDALSDLGRFDPMACRAHVEERFSPKRMVRDYVAVFEAVAGGTAEPTVPAPA